MHTSNELLAAMARTKRTRRGPCVAMLADEPSLCRGRWSSEGVKRGHFRPGSGEQLNRGAGNSGSSPRNDRCLPRGGERKGGREGSRRPEPVFEELLTHCCSVDCQYKAGRTCLLVAPLDTVNTLRQKVVEILSHA